jgi:hypothetical protein|tara:strand:+ start:2586 stop:2864 length:279 start_codon:yes stop_codon:yes gene_type:complete
MNVQKSNNAIEIIQAHILGLPILLRYKGFNRWFPLDGIAHVDWNFAKYQYKIDDKDKTDEERMENVYRTELGTNFESMDEGVCKGKTTNVLT